MSMTPKETLIILRYMINYNNINWEVQRKSKSKINFQLTFQWPSSEANPSCCHRSYA